MSSWMDVLDDRESPAPEPVDAPEVEPMTEDAARSALPAALVPPPSAVPSRGWRRGLLRLSGGHVNPGLSPAEQREQARYARIRAAVTGCHRIAVVSLKGGVGKTTTTGGLGAALATVRGDRVIAVDANPYVGTLGFRFPAETDATLRDLLADAERLDRYTAVREYTSQSLSRLEVLASSQDPALAETLTEQDYRRLQDVLGRFYSIVLTDTGSDLLYSAMAGVLGLADSLVMVCSPSVDSARSVGLTLDWLGHHGYGHLVQRGVAVLSSVRPPSARFRSEPLEAFLRQRCRAVLSVPHDPLLATGEEIDLARLRPATAEAFFELAALVADGFEVAHER